MSCTHIDEYLANLRPPTNGQQVHKEECTQCFDGQDDEQGVCVCLHCFNGGCLNDDRAHAKLHFQRTDHALGLIIKRTKKPQKVRDDQEPPMKKLALVVPSDQETYNYATSYKCFKCPSGNQEFKEDARLNTVRDGIMSSMASAQQSEVKAWEEELVACEHTLLLEQDDVPQGFQVSPHCSCCDLTSNLWLCLTCASVNCGRQQFGGIGGNGHALEHSKATGHGVGVKLGTITPEGGGDIYCYTCDDSKVDPGLPRHLKHFGMDVVNQQKTDKSMTELQIEHNLKFDFSMTGDDGKQLEPLFGPGLTGLKNLGNSCYMASVLQGIFSLPAFKQRYAESTSHFENCPELLPAECLDCQMYKISDGLLSGRYSHPSTNTSGSADQDPAKRFQEGIKPNMFKALVGRGHEEFSTMRQQDSEEFLQHLIQRLRQEAKKKGLAEEREATETFKFGLEQKLVCSECKGVRLKVDRADSISLPVPVKEIEAPIVVGEGDGGSAAPTKQYEPVEFASCLNLMTEAEALEYNCPQCKKSVQALKSSGFKSFPDVLVVHMRKFQLVNWVPTKLDVPVNVQDRLSLDGFLSAGMQEGETELVEEEAPASNEPEVNEAAVAQLMEMGFPRIRCVKGLLATGNGSADAAMDWLIMHMEDPGKPIRKSELSRNRELNMKLLVWLDFKNIDDPLPAVGAKATTNAGPEPSAEQIEQLSMMGFTAAQSKKALRLTDNNAERAVDWLFAHPDDDGREDDVEMAGVPENQNIGGSSSLPAEYRLKAFISHKGPSVHSGHYVATVRQEDGSWVLFNDEKVVKAEGEANETMKQLAYIYIYERDLQNM